MEQAAKIDFFRQLKTDYKQAKKPLLFTATAGQYLTIGGGGEPGGASFSSAVEALYSMAYTIKMSRKAKGLPDYVICKLEAQWWVESRSDISTVDPKLWLWRLMIRTPEMVTSDDVETASLALLSKGKAKEVKKVLLTELDEGLCVQMLHLGPYERERETIAILRQFMESENLRDNGPHHEIYISDPRRVAPEKLKTILRQPVV